MERQVLFVTGGARSGKSRFAQELAERWQGRLLYIATAEVRDAEMRRRVELHREDRGGRWETLEEPLDLPAALAAVEAYGGALLDCLTLWTSNLLERHGEDDRAVGLAIEGFLEALDRFSGRLCVVTNEVGSGIVPENRLARRFRDWAGKVNQEVAASSNEGFWVVSGMPVRVKPAVRDW